MAKAPSRDRLDLSEAVANTRGVQPWRRVFHVMNGTLVVLALTVFHLQVSMAVAILAAVLLLTLALDAVRLWDPRLNLFFFRTFSTLASPREEKRLASSTWYAFSTLLVLLLFPKAYAAAAILVLAWADPAANVVGRLWGRHPFLKGTLRGTITFAMAAFCALIFFVPWPMALLAATGAALVEVLPIGLDDNFTVPMAVALVLVLAGG